MLSKQDIESVDKQGLHNDYENWPKQAERALKIPMEVPRIKGIRSVVYAGMGGSGCAGDLLHSIALETKGAPWIHVVKDYNLPSFVGEETCVIAVSYSGETEETLNVLRQAHLKKCKVVGISSGGILEEFCKAKSIPYVRIPRTLVPRSALPYLLYTSARVLEMSGCEVLSTLELKRSIQTLRRVRELASIERHFEANDAKKLTYHIEAGFPFIYGPHLVWGALNRFKNSLGENAKIHAIVDTLPEMCHNTLEAWRRMMKVNARVVLVKNEGMEETMVKRFMVLERMIKNTKVRVKTIYTEGSTPFEKNLFTLYFLEYVSLYLAVVKHIDPTRTPRIDQFKQILRNSCV